MFECKERTKDGHEEQLSVTQQFGIIKSSDASIANPSLSLDDWRIVAIGDIVFNKYKAHSGVFFVSPFSGIVLIILSIGAFLIAMQNILNISTKRMVASVNFVLGCTVLVTVSVRYTLKIS